MLVINLLIYLIELMLVTKFLRTRVVMRFSFLLPHMELKTFQSSKCVSELQTTKSTLC